MLSFSGIISPAGVRTHLCSLGMVCALASYIQGGAIFSRLLIFIFLFYNSMVSSAVVYDVYRGTESASKF